MTVPIRRKARELAMQALYQCETSGLTGEEAFELLLGNFESNKKAVAYASELLSGVDELRQEIDKHLKEQSEHWRVERMALVDRNILRIAVYELCAKPEIPASVIINEAIEIAGRYSTEDSAPFINGVLDAVRQRLGRE